MKQPKSARLGDVARDLVGHGHEVICEVQHLPHHLDHLLGAATKRGYGEDRHVVTRPKIRWAVGTPIASVNAAPAFRGTARPGDCQTPTRWASVVGAVKDGAYCGAARAERKGIA